MCATSEYVAYPADARQEFQVLLGAKQILLLSRDKFRKARHTVEHNGLHSNVVDAAVGLIL